MPKNAENITQPTETPTGQEATPAPQASRRGGRAAAKSEPAAEEAAPAAAPPAEAPAEGNGQAAPAVLAGLRGEQYVKALAGHPLTTLQVPLQESERRGDWERAKGQKILVTSRQLNHAGHWLERDHALCGVIVTLERPGATRYDQITLKDISARQAVERLSDYMNQTRLRAQTQTGKKWTATHIYLIPVEDADA